MKLNKNLVIKPICKRKINIKKRNTGEILNPIKISDEEQLDLSKDYTLKWKIINISIFIYYSCR